MTRPPLALAAALLALAACAPRAGLRTVPSPDLATAPADSAAGNPAQQAFFDAARSLCVGTHPGEILERAGRRFRGVARTFLDVRECNPEQVRLRFVMEGGAAETLILRHRDGRLTLESFGVGNPIFGRNVNYVLVPAVGGTESLQRFVADRRSLEVEPRLRNQVATLQVIPGERLAFGRVDADTRSRQLALAYDLSREATLPGPTDLSRGPVSLDPLPPVDPRTVPLDPRTGRRP